MTPRVPDEDTFDFEVVEIEYTLPDRFGLDQEGDPHDRHVQNISATISLTRVGETDEASRQIGEMTLAKIDLTEPEIRLWDVFDSHSEEWNNYTLEITAALEQTDARHILIAHRVSLDQDTRGRGIGLHALARGIRTWGQDAIVAMLAWPTETPEDTSADLAAEHLASYWAQLGVTRQPMTDEATVPLLLGDTRTPTMAETLTRLSTWESDG
ncbi:MAG: hypothetical protein JHD16_00020 [Solirubrobacteraceae bacterium]|nr:hypothetical protein [Solirubrobacteraceae bacterium]